MRTFNLKYWNQPADSFGQRRHSVYSNDLYIGTLYDNRECDSQPDTWVFAPQTSRVAGDFRPSENEDYLIHAKGVRGEDIDEVLTMIKEWVYAIEEEMAYMMNAWRDSIDSLSVPEYKLSSYARGGYCGVNAIVLGRGGRFETIMSWDDLAKMYSYSFTELNQYQVSSCGLHAYNHGLKWTYMKGSKYINVIGGSTLYATIDRSEAAIALDSKID